MRTEVEISDYVIEEVLSIEYEDRRWKLSQNELLTGCDTWT